MNSVYHVAHMGKRILIFIVTALLAGCSTMFYYPSKALLHNPASLNLKPQEIFFHSADGTKLFAWYFKNSSSKKAKGVILQYHGNAENLSSHYLSLVWLLKHGYDLMVFDYRGYGRSEGDVSRLGTIADGEAALRMANERAKGVPLIVYGQSLGGAVALRNAIDLKNEVPIKLIVIESSFPSYQKMARNVLARSFITWPFQWLAYLLINDDQAPDKEIYKISPTPILVIHGKQDATVEYSLGENIFKQAGPPKDFWSLDQAGHLDIYFLEEGKYRAEFLQRLEAYL